MERLLDSINDPSKLQNLTKAQLIRLADELRIELLASVSQTGGHLAPNLGVVELTLALHSSFNSPADRIVWDVGHQSYIHKMLTGRREAMSTLRQFGGLSGFPKRSESIHDVFGTGHSSTSISAALGIACARDLAGEDYHVVAVIGDGSMTGGQAFEALNHAGHLGKRLIVVLNDNEMSISHNVGALAQYLTRLRMDPTLRRVKEDVETILSKIPAIGGKVVRTVSKVKDSMKYLLVPGMLFEELGFSYIGPINGHDIMSLKKVFETAKSRKEPVLIHVVTVKGKGYRFAEDNPEHFHSIGPFDIGTGRSRTAAIKTYTDCFSEHMLEIGHKDDKVVAITAAMSEGTGLTAFGKAFSQRFYDVGIAEPHAVTLAAGMATQGLKPVVSIYSSFMQRAYDQILHDVCLQNLGVVFVLDRAGLVGPDGPTHHGIFDFAYLRHMPNMTVLAPKDGDELKSMLDLAIALEGPVAIRIPKAPIPDISFGFSDTSKSVPGLHECLISGSDVAIIAAGSMVSIAADASNQLGIHGIKAALVNARYIKPLDVNYLSRLALSYRLIVTVEEHVLEGGFGSAVLECLSAAGVQARVLRLGFPDLPIEHGERWALFQKYGLDSSGICNSILKELEKEEGGSKSKRRQSRRLYSLELLAH